ncbi:hypothetical protein [Streptomyces sp. NPDC020681]|uniref:hypothetical protein n=1 Tax=Streptomyces sp. NPDC020681 TaxID=3365083 RepID=UPI003790A933
MTDLLSLLGRAWGRASGRAGLGLVLAPLVLAVALTGCGLLPAEDAKVRFATEDDVPELPIDRYQFSTDEYRQHSKAQARLEQRCMVSFGFADFPLDPKQPSPAMSMVAAGTGPYGLLDLDKARRWGYGWDPKKAAAWEPKGRAMTQEERGVLYGTRLGGSATVSGRKVPEAGCSGVASGQLADGVKDSKRMWTFSQDRERSLDKTVEKDPRVVLALKTWSQCVVDKGLGRYQNPQEAFSDKAWSRGQNGNTTRTDRELATATADVECKRKHDTAGEWWEVRREVQQYDVDRDKPAYEAVRKDLDVVRANIRKALGD